MTDTPERAAAALHRLTRHGAVGVERGRERLVSFRPLDPSNRPEPFKRYVGRGPGPLPHGLPRSDERAVDVLSRPAPVGLEGPWDAARLARLLFFSNGVMRTAPSGYGATSYFR